MAWCPVAHDFWPQRQTCKDLWTCLSILQNQDWEIVLPQAIGRYCWGSYQDWLILVKEVDCYNLEISLLNPFSRKKTDLPKTWNFYHKMVLSALPSAENFVRMLVHSQHRELAFCVRGAQSWLKHKLDGEPVEDAVFSDGSFYLLSGDYSISKIKVTNVLAAIRSSNRSILWNLVESFYLFVGFIAPNLMLFLKHMISKHINWISARWH